MATAATRWRSEARNLLKLIKFDDLMSLATTASAGRMAFSTESEAIEAIISHCRNAGELLGKRKMKREYLVRYLWEENYNIDSNASKPQLCRQIMTNWNCQSNSFNSGTNSNDSSFGTIRIEEVDDAEDEPPTSPAITLSGNNNLPSAISVDYDALASSFLQWFYSMLNSTNGANFQRDFAPGHFFDTCTMTLYCGVEPAVMERELVGSQDVANCFAQLIVVEKLLFNANLVPNVGYSTVFDPHGSVLIKNSGVIHRHSSVIGPFSAYFMLIQEPVCKTWKIQRIVLSINAPIAQMLGQ